MKYQGCQKSKQNIFFIYMDYIDKNSWITEITINLMTKFEFLFADSSVSCYGQSRWRLGHFIALFRQA